MPIQAGDVAIGSEVAQVARQAHPQLIRGPVTGSQGDAILARLVKVRLGGTDQDDHFARGRHAVEEPRPVSEVELQGIVLATRLRVLQAHQLDEVPKLHACPEKLRERRRKRILFHTGTPLTNINSEYNR